MAYNHEYPYTDPNRHNSDWLLNKMKEVEGEMDEFTALNKITFAGAWDITKQYPAWTIVNIDGTTGYISIKPVPSGVNYTNNDYWQLIVDYTVTLADLQNRVVALENTMGNSDISDIADGTVTGALQEMAADLFSNRRFLYIGDSYETVTGTRWTDIIDSLLGLSNSVVVAQGGYGFVTGQDKKWIDLLDAATIASPETITDVCIIGGANDAWAPSGTLGAAMVSMDTYLKTRFTNLRRVYLGAPCNSYQDSAQHRRMSKVHRDYIAGAAALGWYYLNNIETTLYLPSRMQVIGGNDYIHPSVAGVEAIGRNAAQAILTGSCVNKSDDWTVTLTKASGFAAGSMTITERQYDEFMKVGWSDTSFIPDANMPAGVYTIATCGDLENMMVGVYIQPALTVNGVLKPCTLLWQGYKNLVIITSEAISAGASISLKGADYIVPFD